MTPYDILRSTADTVRLFDGTIKAMAEMKAEIDRRELRMVPGKIEIFHQGCSCGHHALETHFLAAVDRIKRLELALREIAAQDYRGNEPREQRIAREALEEKDR